MKSKIILLLLGMVALIATVVACSDNPSFGGQDDQNKELILKAKSLVQAQGNAVSLPIPDSQQQNQARSTSYLADLTPLWNNAITYKSGDETILIVPLQSDEEIRSKMLIKQGGETSYQFAKTFSRLIVKGELAYVITYMPESEYASAHSDIKNELKYNPAEVNFTGMIVTSKLNGKVNWGYVYEKGSLTHYTAPSHKCHDVNCTYTHNHAHDADYSVIFNLHTENGSRSTNYDNSSETFYCLVCQELLANCKCIYILEFCEKCGQPLQYCTCWDDDKDYENDICAFCGRLKELCTCNGVKCEICKQNPCVCYTCAGCTNAECNCQDGGFCLCK